LINKEKESITVYTDGSCNPVVGVGGWAAIIFREGTRLVLSGSERATTHQRMELTAALESLEYILKIKGKRRDIILYTDSQYLVNLPTRKEKLVASGLTKNERPVRNAQIIQRLFSLLDELPVTIIKVQAHKMSNPAENHNHEVDKLSRKIMRDSVRNNSRKKG
jgi:ribonuclease HI